MVNDINEDLSRVTMWLNANKLKLNLSKTKYMLSDSGKCTDRRDVCVIIDGKEPERVREIKYLGVILDDRLNMKSHIDYISRRAAKKIGFITRMNRKYQ